MITAIYAETGGKDDDSDDRSFIDGGTFSIIEHTRSEYSGDAGGDGIIEQKTESHP